MSEKESALELMRKDIESCHKYLDYINDHKKNVLTAFSLFIENKDEIDKLIIEENDTNSYSSINIESLFRRCIEHDLQKYMYSEFKGYADKWYPIEGSDPSSEAVEEQYILAWKHHYSVDIPDTQISGRHHPEYHTQYEPYVMMTMEDTLEMLIDWTAMSIGFKSSLVDWYNGEYESFKSDIGLSQVMRFEFISKVTKLIERSLKHRFIK